MTAEDWKARAEAAERGLEAERQLRQGWEDACLRQARTLLRQARTLRATLSRVRGERAGWRARTERAEQSLDRERSDAQRERDRLIGRAEAAEHREAELREQIATEFRRRAEFNRRLLHQTPHKMKSLRDQLAEHVYIWDAAASLVRSYNPEGGGSDG